MYEPAEDSFLLKRNISTYAKGIVLDMCTGSGILANEAAQSTKVTNVFAVDIDQNSIDYAKEHHTHKKISWIKSDLFKEAQLGKVKVDCILCNPPYLPSDPADPDAALDGGKKGYEFTERFLKQAKSHLAAGGCILLLTSSLTPKTKVMAISRTLGYIPKLIDREKHFFEELYVICLRRKKRGNTQKR